MKNHCRINLIAASIALITSFSAMAGLGGLNVQSNLGEPFAGTVTVTGEEARILLNGGQVNLSDSSLRSNTRRVGDNVVVSIHSNRVIQDPVLIFQLGVGVQTRQYAAMIDPKGYGANNNTANHQAELSQADRQAAARARVAAVMAESGEAPEAQTAATTARAAAPAPRRNASRTPVRQQPLQYGSEYTIRNGESLSTIANRMRSSGVPVKQIVQALIVANAGLFNGQNADILQPGSVVKIPTVEELHKLAQDIAAANNEAQPQAVATAPVAAPVETPAVAEPVEAAPAAVEVEPAAVEQQPEVQEPAVAAEAEQALPASEPVVAAAPATAAVAAPAAPAPAAAQAQPQESSVFDIFNESGDLWKWLLAGGLGLIALWIVSKLLLNKRKNNEVDEEFSDDDLNDISSFDLDGTSGIGTEKPVTRSEAAAAMGAIASKKQAKAAKASAEDDFPDDIFFTQANEAASQGDTTIDLDLGAIEQEQAGIMSGAVTHDFETKKRQAADWDSIESTESVYETDTPAVSQPVSRHAVAEAPAAQTVKSKAAVEADMEDEDGFILLDFSEPVVEKPSRAASFAAAPAAAKQAFGATQHQTAQTPSSGEGFGTTKPFTATAPAAAEKPATVDNDTTGWNFNKPAAVDNFDAKPFAAEAPATPAQPAVADKDLTGWNFNKPVAAQSFDAKPFEVETPAAAEQPAALDNDANGWNFNKPAVGESFDAKPFAAEAPATSEQPVVADNDLAGWNFNKPAAAESFDANPVATDTPAVAATNNFSSWSLDTPAAVESFDNKPFEAQTQQPAAGNEFDSWRLDTPAATASASFETSAMPAQEPASGKDFAPLDFHAPAMDETAHANPFAVDAAAVFEPAAKEEWLQDTSPNTVIELESNEDFSADTRSETSHTETIEWENLSVDEGNRGGSGFISESVGMTAPLEAKYELAKMYVEIGDPEAAKETLLELLDEADGSILEKTRAMLTELGGQA